MDEEKLRLQEEEDERERLAVKASKARMNRSFDVECLESHIQIKVRLDQLLLYLPHTCR